MSNNKAPYRVWEPNLNYENMFTYDKTVPETFNDDYKNRVRAAAEAKMRMKDDMTYDDLDLVQPEGGSEIGERARRKSDRRKIPNPLDFSKIKLIDNHTGVVFKFRSRDAFHNFKYQRYFKWYLDTSASIDDSVEAIFKFLDESDLAANTIVIYTSDQGFFLD